jgi:hypothetical protein
MRALLVLLMVFAVGALGACKEQTEKTRLEIKSGSSEGGQMKKKYEAAQKEAADKRKEAQ